MGRQELRLIELSDWTEFPPRLPIQPIFYPVLNLEYAREIASRWNTKDEASGFAGFVLAFDLPAEFLSRYPVQVVGASYHQELWVPAEDLEVLNRQIIGKIRVVDSFTAPQ